METLLEVIFSIIGLFLYWLLTSGTKNQKKSPKPAPVPPIVPPKIPQKQVKC
ncbi:MAG: hypothetical protein RMJ89_03075 [Flammeovirgaceae bacterium]|nr:hypothetical protein [Flammeovirgaceae bacterium]